MQSGLELDQMVMGCDGGMAGTRLVGRDSATKTSRGSRQAGGPGGVA